MKLAIVVSIEDNVATLLDDIRKGEVLTLTGVRTGVSIVADQDIERGHKIALVDIHKDSVITKYGTAIGRATTEIRKGYHVHTHNVIGNRTEK